MSGELDRPSEDEIDTLIKRHAYWLESHGTRSRPSDFSSKDLSFKHSLRGHNLAGAICRNTNFGNSDLTSTGFVEADLQGAVFNAGTILANTDFRGAIMDETTDFTGADLRGASVDPSDFKKVNLLVMDEDKIHGALRNLYEKQLRKRGGVPLPKTQTEYTTWLEDFEKSPRGRYGKGPGRH